MRFFHTIVCHGSRRLHGIASTGKHHATADEALAEGREEARRLDRADMTRDYFVRLFEVNDGVGVELDPDTREVIES